MTPEVVTHKNLRQCERYLRESLPGPGCSSIPSEERHSCVCGRVFVHVHDEKEGCYWALRASLP